MNGHDGQVSSAAYILDAAGAALATLGQLLQRAAARIPQPRPAREPRPAEDDQPTAPVIPLRKRPTA